MNIYPHHVLLWVTDMKRAVEFYTETLGFPLISCTDHFSQVGGNRFWIALHLGKKNPKERKGSENPILVIKTDDVDKTYEELRARGVEFFTPPHDEAGVRFAEFYDTEGNKLSISTAD